MITKLQDSSVEKLAGGVETVEYGSIPDGVIAMIAAGPAADHVPFLA